MAIIKLVCQGCGANLDTRDDQRVFQCGYCGTTNQIKQTVQPKPAPPPPPTPPPSMYAQPPVQIHVPKQSSGGRKGILIFVIIMALLPLILGGGITWMVTRATKEVFEQVGSQVGEALGNAGVTGPNGRRFTWASSRPFLADVNGDGSEDIVATILLPSDQKLLLTAISGSDWSTLWETELGRQADLPQAVLRFEAGTKLALFEIGPTLHAYDASTGSERWVASFPDRLQAVILDQDALWVATIDGEHHSVSLADGSVSAADEPSGSAQNMRDDEGYDLIPDLRELDLRSKSFEDLRVEQGFCAETDLPVTTAKRRHKARDKTCNNPNGLAFATRAKGSKVPFMVGYERKSKDERWRVQLTKAGSLETVDSGFGQPRAEIFGPEAVISFVPSSDNNARIRRISLSDGATKWETTLKRQHTENVDGMVVGSKWVVVHYGQSMRVLDLANGQQLAKLGGY